MLLPFPAVSAGCCYTYILWIAACLKQLWVEHPFLDACSAVLLEQITCVLVLHSYACCLPYTCLRSAAVPFSAVHTVSGSCLLPFRFLEHCVRFLPWICGFSCWFCVSAPACTAACLPGYYASAWEWSACHHRGCSPACLPPFSGYLPACTWVLYGFCIKDPACLGSASASAWVLGCLPLDFRNSMPGSQSGSSAWSASHLPAWIGFLLDSRFRMPAPNLPAFLCRLHHRSWVTCCLCRSGLPACRFCCLLLVCLDSCAFCLLPHGLGGVSPGCHLDGYLPAAPACLTCLYLPLPALDFSACHVHFCVFLPPGWVSAQIHLPGYTCLPACFHCLTCLPACHCCTCLPADFLRILRPCHNTFCLGSAAVTSIVFCWFSAFCLFRSFCLLPGFLGFLHGSGFCHLPGFWMGGPGFSTLLPFLPLQSPAFSCLLWDLPYLFSYIYTFIPYIGSAAWITY